MFTNIMLNNVADIFKVLAGGVVASFLVFWLDRRGKRKSVKMALHIEMKDIQNKSNAILKLIDYNSLPDYSSYKELNQINVSFKTPVINASYDKIDLLPKVVVESIVKIKIIIDNLNDILKKKDERGITTPQIINDVNDEIKPFLIQLNLLVDKASIELNN